MKSKLVLATDLMEDDYFRLSSQTYRIADVNYDAYTRRMRIQAYNVNDIESTIQIAVPKHAMFKIYNQ